MAFSEFAEFIGASAGIAIAVVAIVVTLAVFTAIARLGSNARPSPDKK